LDTVYSGIFGLMPEDDVRRVINLIKKIGFEITHPLLEITSEESPVVVGLQEFREHLGGQLTIMLLERIGQGVEVHEIDTDVLKKASEVLRTEYALNPA